MVRSPAVANYGRHAGFEMLNFTIMMIRNRYVAMIENTMIHRE